MKNDWKKKKEKWLKHSICWNKYCRSAGIQGSFSSHPYHMAITNKAWSYHFGDGSRNPVYSNWWTSDTFWVSIPEHHHNERTLTITQSHLTFLDWQKKTKQNIIRAFFWPHGMACSVSGTKDRIHTPYSGRAES